MEEKQIKKCPRCGRELPLEEFNKCSKSKDGRQYICKDCQREAMRKSYRKEKGMAKVYNNPELAKFQPRELIAELRARGYSGELSFTQRITV